jgi:hypothetical protein
MSQTRDPDVQRGALWKTRRLIAVDLPGFGQIPVSTDPDASPEGRAVFSLERIDTLGLVDPDSALVRVNTCLKGTSFEAHAERLRRSRSPRSCPGAGMTA